MRETALITPVDYPSMDTKGVAYTKIFSYVFLKQKYTALTYIKLSSIIILLCYGILK